jgi:hypothetical protein
MRNSYWNSGKFADWLRGSEKPESATAKGWKEWEENAKKDHPIRYWIVEEGLDSLQKFIYWPVDKLYSLKYYVINRWIDQSHALVAHPNHIKPGQYQDFSNRILICLFDELVDFVEIEKAYSNYRWSEEKQKGMKWWQVGKWRTRTWRSSEAGLAHLEWETTLTDEEWLGKDENREPKLMPQAETAKEIIVLYKWWTEVYPNRPEPMDVSGWSAYCDDKQVRGIDLFDEDPEADEWDTRPMHDKMREIEKNYADEDTEMLIRLIKIRGHLWT